MALYRINGILPPDHLRQAMKEAGVPEEKMWGIREEIRKLEEPPPPPIEPKHRNKKKVTSPPSGPPEISWHGNITLRGHSVDLAELNKRDRKLAAAHDED